MLKNGRRKNKEPSWKVVYMLKQNEYKAHVLISYDDWMILIGKIQGKSYRQIAEDLELTKNIVRYRATRMGIPEWDRKFLKRLTCEGCDHNWQPRVAQVTKCPQCGSHDIRMSDPNP